MKEDGIYIVSNAKGLGGDSKRSKGEGKGRVDKGASNVKAVHITNFKISKCVNVSEREVVSSKGVRGAGEGVIVSKVRGSYPSDAAAGIDKEVKGVVVYKDFSVIKDLVFNFGD